MSAATNGKCFTVPPGLTVLRELVETDAPGRTGAISNRQAAAPRGETCVLKVVSRKAHELAG